MLTKTQFTKSPIWIWAFIAASPICLFAEQAAVETAKSKSDARSENPNPPTSTSVETLRPVLPPEAAEHVAQLVEEVKSLKKDKNFDEAIRVVQEILQIRNMHQSGWIDSQGEPAEWYEITDARIQINELRLIHSLAPEQKSQVDEMDVLWLKQYDLFNAGQYTDALHTIKSLLEMQIRVLGENHTYTFDSYGNVGFILTHLGRYAEAEEYYQKALKGHQRLLGAEHPRALRSCNNLASLLTRMARYEDAEAYCYATLRARRHVLGNDHPHTVFSINAAAHLAEQTGKTLEAQEYFRESMLASLRVFGPDHSNTVRSTINMGYILKLVGNYSEAQEYYDRALILSRRILGETHPDTLVVLQNKGTLLATLGRFAEAEACYHEAIRGFQQTLGDDHPETIGSLGGLGALLSHLGRVSEAEDYLTKSLEGSRRVLGSDHPNTLGIQRDVGRLYEQRGSVAEAEEYYRDTIERMRGSLGNRHSELILPLVDLARLLKRTGKPQEAIKYYSEALQLGEAERTQVVGDERDRALYSELLMLGDIAEELVLLLIQEHEFTRAWNVLERGRARELLDLLSRSDRDLVAQAKKHAQQSGSMHDMTVLEKALANEQKVREELVEREAISNRSQQDRRSVAGRTDLAEEDRKLQLESLDAAIEQQNIEIRSKRQALSNAKFQVLSALQSAMPDANPLDLESVRAQLNRGELLVAYVWQDEAVAIMMVPALKEGNIRVTYLAHDRQEVAAMADQVAKSLERLVSGKDPVSAKALCSSLLPSPFEAQVRQARRVVLLPDGPLHQIPFEVLESPSSKLQFLESGPEWVIAYSASMYLNRRNVLLKKPADGSPTAVVLGDPVYTRDEVLEHRFPERGVLLASVEPGSNADLNGLKSGDVLLTYNGHVLDNSDALSKIMENFRPDASKDPQVQATYWSQGVVQETSLLPGELGIVPSRDPDLLGQLRAVRSADRSVHARAADALAENQLRLMEDDLAPLPNTRLEAEAIVRMFRKATQREQSCTLLVGEDATVTQLTQSVPGCRFIHLASHGAMGSSDSPFDACLALTRPKQHTSDDMGFLRLQDLIRNWRGKLNECRLVVLSACDTQRGVQKGTSIMTLPVGFMYAGSPTVLASLWKVDDTATMILMVRFYENLLGLQDQVRHVCGSRYVPGHSMGIIDALREAKLFLKHMTLKEVIEWCRKNDAKESLEILDRRHKLLGDEAKVYEHPYYWAAFVLLGDA